ncbi:hypothetical protein H7J77_08235 [Mycolicibacillus parakoreensis]|uniref:Secreted protein n=1 Tax=Mycolicibacillus parakoreensis TaxID=1069221 RepID=A0ABY3TXS5_9MYCO|nr:hypothetical protein [Mycolicibacillus parakoreensis]MCV7315527.1 hypothetical protein [Mycolicibacillus parakoreensis]ULN52022.1 hypothetical protein MIU77_14260 [Mycolicibacillus parakoreensis]
MRGILSVVVVVWLLIGVVASWQRGYLQNTDTTCATAGTIAVTIVAGPLNYFGVNPKVTDCRLPEPSATGPDRHQSPPESEWS